MVVFVFRIRRITLTMKTKKENTWVVEDTKESTLHTDKTRSHAVSSEETENKRAKRKGENNIQKVEYSSNIELGSEAKKRKQKKRKKTKNIKAVDNSNGNKEKCISYLKRWHEDRQNWKFEKLRQIWLFQNMLDPSKVPDSSFQILVDYMSGARGHARKMVVEKTMKVVKAMELWSKLSEEGMKEEDIAVRIPDGKVPEIMYERARSILQSLDDV